MDISPLAYFSNNTTQGSVRLLPTSTWVFVRVAVAFHIIQERVVHNEDDF